MAEQALEMGYYISISGIVTFRNAENVREVARRGAHRAFADRDRCALAGTSSQPRQR